MSKGLEVLVDFPSEVPTSVQGVALLRLEVFLRTATGLDVRVVKKLQGDDSRLRIKMTQQEREKL